MDELTFALNAWTALGILGLVATIGILLAEWTQGRRAECDREDGPAVHG
jgi:hypothetical protein